MHANGDAAPVWWTWMRWTAILGVIFIAIVVSTRYVSLGSITAAVLIPVFVWLQSVFVEPVFDLRPLLTAAIAGAALIVFAHRGNIKRLASRTESQI